MKLQAKILGSKVHEVGYRVFLLHKAIELGCRRFSAYNRFHEEFQGIPALLRIDKTQDKMLEKQDKMLGKQDATISKLEEIRADIVQDIRTSRVEVTAKLDENRESIIDEISCQKETLDDRLKRIEIDIFKLKAKVGI